MAQAPRLAPEQALPTAAVSSPMPEAAAILDDDDRMTLTAVALGWRTPIVPPAHPLAKVFKQAVEDGFIQLAPLFGVLIGLMYLSYIWSDLLLYHDHLWALLPMRLMLAGSFLLASAICYWYPQRTVQLRTSQSAVTSHWLLVAGTLIASQDPTGPYFAALIGGVIIASLIPYSTRWFVANIVVLWLSYALAILLQPQPPGTRELAYLLTLIVTGLFALVIFRNMRCIRWHDVLLLKKTEALLAEQHTYNQQLERDLAVARQIQQSLLPSAYPALSGLDVACYSQAANEVGGDFYVYHEYPDQRVLLGVGDVSGKGLPAALIMSTCVTIFSTAALHADSPRALLGYFDLALAPYTRSTRQNCGMAVIEVQHRRVLFANAGGITPLLRRANGEIHWIEVGGLPLGFGHGAIKGYQEHEYMAQPGDTLILCSDGVLEAHNPDSTLFGFERMAAALATCPYSSSTAILNAIRNDLSSFTGDAQQHDDITLIVIRVT